MANKYTRDREKEWLQWFQWGLSRSRVRTSTSYGHTFSCLSFSHVVLYLIKTLFQLHHFSFFLLESTRSTFNALSSSHMFKRFKSAIYLDKNTHIVIKLWLYITAHRLTHHLYSDFCIASVCSNVYFIVWECSFRNWMYHGMICVVSWCTIICTGWLTLFLCSEKFQSGWNQQIAKLPFMMAWNLKRNIIDDMCELNVPAWSSIL